MTYKGYYFILRNECNYIEKKGKKKYIYKYIYKKERKKRVFGLVKYFIVF